MGTYIFFLVAGVHSGEDAAVQESYGLEQSIWANILLGSFQQTQSGTRNTT